MAKITRKKLARGAKLVAEHIFPPLADAQTQMTSASIESEQLESRYVPMRLNFSIPLLSGATNATRADRFGLNLVTGTLGGPCHGIPFMLPPLQEFMSFDTNARGEKSVNLDDNAPPIFLDEVSFSFDQRAEPCAIQGNWATGANDEPSSPDAGQIVYEGAQDLRVNLSIRERRPQWFDGNVQSKTRIGRIVWSATVEPINLEDRFFRLNPWVASDINESVDPYKSYVLSIDAPDLASSVITGSKDLALVSVEVSVRFLVELTQRDSGASIQNIPLRHLGVPNANLTHAAAGTTGAGPNSATPRPLISAAPVAGNMIEANDATLGVQTQMGTVDEFMRRKLHGGYEMSGDLPMLEELQDTAGYSVIAVPLFNNLNYGGIVSDDWSNLPYQATSSTVGSWAMDRRYIPIVAPMTIHHVLFTYSWMKFFYWDGVQRVVVESMPTTIGGAPGPATLQLEMGVGIGTGAKGDSFGYQQVASRTLAGQNTSGTWYGQAVDLIRHGSRITLPLNPNPLGLPAHTDLLRRWNLELHTMELVGGPGSPSLGGMAAQGKPVFVGRTPTTTSGRTNIGGGPSAVEGEEQWIEVRARIGDVAGNNIGTHYAPNSMILGAGGIWVYIIGKTHLV